MWLEECVWLANVIFVKWIQFNGCWFHSERFFFWNNKRCKIISMKNPLVKQYTNTVFFELLLTYQELLYFNFCLDFHMFCMYFKEFQSASAMKSSNLAKDCVWWLKIYFQVFLYKCQDNKKGRPCRPCTEGSCLMRLLVLEKIHISQNSH